MKYFVDMYDLDSQTSSKRREYRRTAEHIQDIAKGNNGLYFALAFLHDASYTMKDIGYILAAMENSTSKTISQRERP